MRTRRQRDRFRPTWRYYRVWAVGYAPTLANPHIEVRALDEREARDLAPVLAQPQAFVPGVIRVLVGGI